MRTIYTLFLIIIIDLIFLLYGVNTLSISYKEAIVFYSGDNFLHYLVKFSTNIFGENDFALRIPFILFHVLSIFLIFEISKFYIKRDEDRLISVCTFVLLPGVVSSALLVNSASVVIFFTMLFVYLFLQKRVFLYSVLLPLLVFIDNSFFILYLGLIFYGLYEKNRYLVFISSLLFLLSLYLYGLDSIQHGKPRGYFLDTFGAYSLIFSPLIFLYFFYTMYQILIKGKKSIVWFISFVSLVISILLSFRQRIIIEDFAPFVVISIPLMVQVFSKSYRTRLPELRGFHRIFFVFIFSFLILNFFATYFNQYFYRYLDKPSKHFAYKYHIVKELSQKLKDKNITNIKCDNKSLELRLKFYGVNKGNDLQLLLCDKNISNTQKVTLSYMNYPIICYSVSKVNK